MEELSVAVERRTAVWKAQGLDRLRSRVELTSWAAFCQRMIEQRPAAEVAAELGLSAGAVSQAAEGIKRMVIQECRDDASPGLPG